MLFGLWHLPASLHVFIIHLIVLLTTQLYHSDTFVFLIFKFIYFIHLKFFYKLFFQMKLFIFRSFSFRNFNDGHLCCCCSKTENRKFARSRQMRSDLNILEHSKMRIYALHHGAFVRPYCLRYDHSKGYGRNLPRRTKLVVYATLCASCQSTPCKNFDIWGIIPFQRDPNNSLDVLGIQGYTLPSPHTSLDLRDL